MNKDTAHVLYCLNKEHLEIIHSIFTSSLARWQNKVPNKYDNIWLIVQGRTAHILVYKHSVT